MKLKLRIQKDLFLWIGDAHFERPRGDVAVFAHPELLDELGVGFGDLALHAQRVVFVQLVRVLVFEEVLRQRRDVTQTLRESRRGGR